MDQNHQEEMKAVWERYKAGVATSDDHALLESWYLDYTPEALVPLNAEEIENRVAAVRLNLPVNDAEQPASSKTIRLWPRIAVAAAVLAVLATAFYFYTYPAVDLKKEAFNAGVVPGRNKAVLRLADGSEISLTDATNGKLAEQAGVTVSKAEDGQLVYTVADNGEKQPASKMNTISTPNGGQWQVRLPDGTIVWLNAASTLSYPVSFKGERNRTVTLNGEAYFEVAKDKDKPFVVHSEKQDVEVLGTHFNINAYTNEPTLKTTLLEGAVKVNVAGKTAAFLKPGEQAVLTAGGIKTAEMNVQLSIDWKNDEFRFKNESLSSILRKVSRWYDVNIIYTSGQHPMPTFSGSVSRFEDVSAILKMLEQAGDVKFSIEGKNIRVE